MAFKKIIVLEKNINYFNHLLQVRTKKSIGKSFGKLVLRHRFQGNKKKFRVIDFYRAYWNFKGVIINVEYDPNRFNLLFLILYTSGVFSYILAVKGLNVGDSLMASNKCNITSGNAMLLKNIPFGTYIHLLESKPCSKSKYTRSAGSISQLLYYVTNSNFIKKKNYLTIKLSSGEIKNFFFNCIATIGLIYEFFHKFKYFGSFKKKYFFGWRPKVRGVAKNAVDHPHGGGKGKKSGKANFTKIFF